MVFVFGSNLAGRHGKGAALYAKMHYGAETGVGEGRTGQAYAIPTKDENLRVLPLSDIGLSIGRFIDYAKHRPDTEFLLTPIGTGLAGYKKAKIWQFLKLYHVPSNVYLTSTWVND